MHVKHRMGQIYGGSAALSCKYLKHVKTLKHSQPVQAAYGQSSTVTSPRSDLKDDVLAAITSPLLSLCFRGYCSPLCPLVATHRLENQVN